MFEIRGYVETQVLGARLLCGSPGFGLPAALTSRLSCMGSGPWGWPSAPLCSQVPPGEEELEARGTLKLRSLDWWPEDFLFWY